MATTKEEETVAVEKPKVDESTPVVTAEEAKPTEDKPVKEKKKKQPKAPKEKKPKEPKPKAAAHPPYFQMIEEALVALNDKSGSSAYAIAKYMEEKHKAVLPSNYKKILALQLKNSVSRGKLIKIKASFKLTESGEKENTHKAPTTTAKANKITKPKKESETKARGTKKTVKSTAKAISTTTRKTRSVNKAVENTKVAKSKRSAAAAAKPKQPKSIKSPAAKRAKKAVA